MTSEECEALITHIRDRDIFSLLESYPSLETLIREFYLMQIGKRDNDLLGNIARRLNILEEKVRMLYEVDEESRADALSQM